MFIDFFTNVNVSSKLFALKDTKLSYSLVAKDTALEIATDEIDDKLKSYYEINKGKKVIIKAFSFQPNLNAYGIIINEKKEDLEKGLEKLKSLNEIKFVVSKKDKKIFEDLKPYGEVIKVTPIIDLYDNKLMNKVYNKTDDVIIYDILDIIKLGQSLQGKKVENFITVYGSAVDGNKVLAINSDTTYNDVLKTLNGKEDELSKVINGGSFNGTPVYDLDSKISQNSKGLLFLTDRDLSSDEKYSCINCSKCLRICPEGLNPIKIMDLVKRNEKEDFAKFGGYKCIDCGLCSFVCPSNIEIAQTIKTAKVFNK